MKYFKKSDFEIKKWPGGTTTQLFIYPSEADYQKRNFLFRISTATVEVEKSDFTSLPGFHRKLMVLEGELAIHHKNHYSKNLKKFEQDEFDGGWETSAEGRVTDFNLMMADGVEGSIEILHLEKDQKCPMELNKFSFVYLHKGGIAFGEQALEQGDFVSIDDFHEISLTALEKSELIICSVKIDPQAI